jgi:hypothetical protein
MVLLTIKNIIFAGLERPVRRFIASNDRDIPMTAEYYVEKDYEQLFDEHLHEVLNDGAVQQKIVNELLSGAAQFARKVMWAPYSQWSTNQVPRAIKKIASYSEQYPHTSELLMSFYNRHVASVDAVNEFGESAFAKILKGKNQHKSRSLLFLAQHGAKLTPLSSSMQDALLIENSDIYHQVEDNTSAWKLLTL